MKITISGDVGSGKSTVAKTIAKKLGLKHYSIGDFMRELAAERGVSLNELGDIAVKDKTVDDTLDGKQIKLGKEEDNFIIDARLGYHFIPDSIKIFLRVDIDEAVKRIVGEGRKDEKYKDIEQAKQELIKRMDYEKTRYKKHYDIDFPDLDAYDAIIDTTGLSIEDVVDKVLALIKRYSDKIE